MDLSYPWNNKILSIIYPVEYMKEKGAVLKGYQYHRAKYPFQYGPSTSQINPDCRNITLFC